MQSFLKNPFVLIISFLAVIGLGSQLIFNPSGLLLMLVITAVIGVILYFVLTRFIRPQVQGQRVDPNYKRALKQDKQRRKTNNKNPDAVSVKKKRNPTHLKVVNGKKKNARR
ncbi:SA1362 family protein [Geomicrobium sediminis]|uniref:Uncharacterized protein n=1 Tax=Geomicrobium sediminis TaxID=1347788 RepID=A0ABS2PE07_9BACL|nr:SA1362 family protein [Geomicrobium sediminis]MBM7633665.1 hypothetical protein [Geomicrobium sediminis]